MKDHGQQSTTATEKDPALPIKTAKEDAQSLKPDYQELEDEDLEQVAGGWSAGSNDPCGP